MVSVADLLRELLAGQRQIIELLERQRRPVSHEKPLTDLSQVLAAAVGDRAFSAREVMQHALVDASLQTALSTAGIVNARRLGKLLRRLEGQTIAGVRVTRIGQDSQGIVWRVS